MASGLLLKAGSLVNRLRTSTATSLRICSSSLQSSGERSCLIYRPNLLFSKCNDQLLVQPCRHGTFFTQVTAEDLWKGVVGVSNAGKKKGRGKRVGRKRITNLNKGQILGVGKANIQFPGLNAPIIKGREVLQQKTLPPNPEREQQLIKLRDQMGKIRYTANAPLLRGWSGSRFPGQSVGPPDPIAGHTFEEFDSRCIEFRLVSTMSGTLGRKMSFSAFVVTGNKKGLAGFGIGKSQNGRAAIRLAKNRAAQRLRSVPLFNDHTVYHNMYAENHHSKVFIHKKEEGHGLRCHRALKTICELIGIKDLYCKVEGNTKNVRAITNAFFDALTNQETHAELADRMGYIIVEMSKERGNLPVVVASPSNGVVNKEPLKDEEEDLEVEFDRLYYGGKCPLVRPPRRRFYADRMSWKKKVEEMHIVRNQRHAQILRKAGLS